MPANPQHASTPALSHVAHDGQARMVDVGEKPVTERSAIAEGFVRVSNELAAAIEASTVTKGSVLEVARLAGILAAKRTDELIPLCHMLPLDAVDVSATLEPAGASHGPRRVRVIARVRTRSRTGVEMEALTAVSVACLTVIDMGKAIDKAMVIEGVRVLEKHGGRSGSYVAPDGTSASAAGARGSPMAGPSAPPSSPSATAARAARRPTRPAPPCVPCCANASAPKS